LKKVISKQSAHWEWHPNGFLYKAGVLDFAGGNVIHISSGMSGLATVAVLGKNRQIRCAAIVNKIAHIGIDRIGNRKGFGQQEFEPHSVLYTVVGMSMLWIGWFGFNGGSAQTAGDAAGSLL